MASPGKLGLAGAGLAGRKGPDQPGPPEPTLSGQTKASATRETNAMEALRALMAASIAIRQPAHDHRNHHRSVSIWDRPHNRFPARGFRKRHLCRENAPPSEFKDLP
jgi:hypothetical protein